jgi:hypothetical protein
MQEEKTNAVIRHRLEDRYEMNAAGRFDLLHGRVYQGPRDEISLLVAP